MIGSRTAPAVTVVALAVVLAACTTTTNGTPRVAPVPPGTTPATTPTTTPAPSGSPAPSGTGGSTVPTAGARFTDQGAADDAIDGARAAVQHAFSYDYRHLARDRTTALSYTIGRYRSELRQSYAKVIEPRAAKARAMQRARVSNAGLTDLDDAANQARVLVFGKLRASNTTSGRTTTPITLSVTVRKPGERWLISSVDTVAPTAGPPPGTDDLAAAYTAAQREAIALITYSRDTFDADFRRALRGAGGQLRADVRTGEAATERALVKGGFDTGGDLTAAGVASAGGDSVTVLVAVNGYQRKGGAKTSIRPQRVVLTMRKASAGWLAVDLRSIG